MPKRSGIDAATIDEAAAEATEGEDLAYLIEGALERAELIEIDEEVE